MIGLLAAFKVPGEAQAGSSPALSIRTSGIDLRGQQPGITSSCAGPVGDHGC
jgi:hypothetical protein